MSQIIWSVHPDPSKSQKQYNQFVQYGSPSQPRQQFLKESQHQQESRMQTDSQLPAHGEFQAPLPDTNKLLSELQELKEKRESFFQCIEELNTEID